MIDWRAQGNRQAISRSRRGNRNRRNHVRLEPGQPRRQVPGQDGPHHVDAFGSESVAAAAARRALLRRRWKAVHEENPQNGSHGSEAIEEGPAEDCEEHCARGSSDSDWGIERSVGA